MSWNSTPPATRLPRVLSARIPFSQPAESAEDLFVLAADAGLENLTVILAPVDFRAGKSVQSVAKLPPWTDSLYQEIKTRLAELPPAKPDGR